MSATKRVRFAEEENHEYFEESNPTKRSRLNDNEEKDDDDNELPGTSKAAKKHTLDSDEEDEADKYEILDMDKVEGQEDATLEYEGEVKIMPFNMKDDMEEGHFDADGTFIYDKKEALIRDAWLDNIEWDKVKDKAGKSWGKMNDEREDTPDKQQTNVKSIYSRLLEILQGKDTIAAALKKLNNEKGVNAAEERKRRWAAKKAGTSLAEDPRNQKVAELTALADSLVSMGNMEAYQLEPEKIRNLLSEFEPKLDVPGAKDATMDMFAE